MRIPWMLLFAIGCATAPVASSPAQPPPSLPQSTPASVDKDCALVSDRLYSGGNGRAIFGKFETLERMAETLRMDAEVGRHEGRVWHLHDILVSVDVSSNGYNASWIISGPEPVLTEYIARLQRGYADRSVLYDFSVTPHCISPAFD